MGMRKCSQCGKTGHNSRTCRNGSSKNNDGQSMKLFGVELVNLPSSHTSSPTKLLSSHEDSDNFKSGYNFPNGHIGKTQAERKKGVPWSDEEHRLFLLGLEKLGKGNWRGISKNFVTTRTSTQVASHAQKHFLRCQNNANKNSKICPTTILSMVGRNEAKSISVGTYSRKRPINPLFTLPDIPYSNFRLFNYSATQSSPCLELSLAAPPPPLPPPVWSRGRLCYGRSNMWSKLM